MFTYRKIGTKYVLFGPGMKRISSKTRAKIRTPRQAMQALKVLRDEYLMENLPGALKRSDPSPSLSSDIQDTSATLELPTETTKEEEETQDTMPKTMITTKATTIKAKGPEAKATSAVSPKGTMPPTKAMRVTKTKTKTTLKK